MSLRRADEGSLAAGQAFILDPRVVTKSAITKGVNGVQKRRHSGFLGAVLKLAIVAESVVAIGDILDVSRVGVLNVERIEDLAKVGEGVD